LILKTKKLFCFIKVNLVNLAYHNQDTYNNIDDMREDLTIDAGFYRTTENKRGEVVKRLYISLLNG
jgi:hypothetical protein